MSRMFGLSDKVSTVHGPLGERLLWSRSQGYLQSFSATDLHIWGDSQTWFPFSHCLLKSPPWQGSPPASYLSGCLISVSPTERLSLHPPAIKCRDPPQHLSAPSTLLRPRFLLVAFCFRPMLTACDRVADVVSLAKSEVALFPCR